MEINTKKASLEFLRFHVWSCFKDVKNENLHLEKHNFYRRGRSPSYRTLDESPSDPTWAKPFLHALQSLNRVNHKHNIPEYYTIIY